MLLLLAEKGRWKEACSFHGECHREDDPHVWKGNHTGFHGWKDMRKILISVSLFILSSITEIIGQEKRDLRTWIAEAEFVLEKADGYTAIFHKQERVNGQLNGESRFFIKFRKPFKIYIKWMNDPHNKREAFYVYGEDGNRIRFHQEGTVGRVKLSLDPAGPLAMKGNRHPITHLGLEYLLKNIKKDLCRAIPAGKCKIQDYGEEVVYGRKTREVQVLFPKDQSEGYYCYRILINLDFENKLPIRVQVFDWDDKLVEMYGYENLNLNPGLTDADFDPKNPKCKFY